jgi:hypothetical protein
LRALTRSVLAAAIVGALVACGSPTRTHHLTTTTGGRGEKLIDPYKASLAFARCMRQHGVPHPNPDSAGNFHLTPRQEQLMKRATPQQHELAERKCFHFLKPVVSTRPLSAHAKALARVALRGLAACMRSRGYDFYESPPVVGNLSRGRAFFGFERADPRLKKVEGIPRFLRARTACEQKLNAKLDAIIAADRHVPQY